ncbi:MAG: membrane protein insertion efficiency factor YidD [Planctomycetaceae bacterium]|nr:membrane protein insertion efficiency factor YidD [Planctomycetaceae bacterium]
MAETGTGHRKRGSEGGRIFWPPPVQAPPLNFWKRPLSWLAIAWIRCYQRSLSHLWPNTCIYHPSCSNYMIHAITARGLIRGGLLGTWRIVRCHPFAEGGYDPPPGYEEACAAADAEDRAAAGDTV